MPKFYLDADEWYPVYSLRPVTEWTPHDCIVELSKNEYREYQTMMDAFDEWQDRLRSME